MTTHRIQIDEETGADTVWDALHAYAAAHPTPDCLRAYVDGVVCWPDASALTASEAESAKQWLAECAEACGWDDDVTPILVLPIGRSGVEVTSADCPAPRYYVETRITMATDGPGSRWERTGPSADEAEARGRIAAIRASGSPPNCRLVRLDWDPDGDEDSLPSTTVVEEWRQTGSAASAAATSRSRP